MPEPREAAGSLQMISYCGLYCNLCGQRSRIPKLAQALRKAMETESWEAFGGFFPQFKEFWDFLNRICAPTGVCPACRQGGGPPWCSIRSCACKRNIDICVFCEEYPCHRIEAIARGYPTLIPDGKRLREIGINKWVEEQEKRAETGFAYADIRCYPYEVPKE